MTGRGELKFYFLPAQSRFAMIAGLDSTNRPLRIVVADDEGFMRKYLQTILPRLGHEVVAIARTGRQLVDQCRELRPDLVITDVNMPEMDGLEAAAAIYDAHPVPIIVISGYHGAEVMERTLAAHVMAYLVKPVKQADLDTVIVLAVRRFEQLQALESEAAALRSGQQEHEIVERAMRVLMNWTRKGEDEALERLHRMASDKQLSLLEIAQTILVADEAIGPRNEPQA
jgi:AmiR/NasT family two-component response regulator